MTMQTQAGPGHGKRRTGKTLMLIGLVIGLISLVAAVWGGSSAFQSVGDLVEESQDMTGGVATVELAEGEERALYSQDATGEAIECSVTGPGGEDVPLRTGGDGGGDFEQVIGLGAFTVQEAGTYTATCTGGATFIGPVVDLSGAAPGFFALLGGLAGMGLAFMFFLIGLILWFVGRSQDRSAPHSTGYGGPGQSYGGAHSYGGGQPYAGGQSYGEGQSHGGGQPHRDQSADSQSFGGQPYGGQAPDRGNYPPPPPPRSSDS